MSLKDELMKEIFDDSLDLDDEKILTIEHVRVLEQFLDYTGIDPQQLKHVLVDGFIFG